MFPILSSRRGADTAPLFIVFAAVVLMMTTVLAFDIMGKWEKIDSKQRTYNEAKRISQTCEEIKFAGDQGSIQEVQVNIPQKCSILIGSKSLTASCTFDKEKSDEPVLTKAILTGSPATIPAGSNTVRIVYSSPKTTTATAGTYIIYVS
jgi:hypothetical protein